MSEGWTPPAPTVSEWVRTLAKFSQIADKFEYTEWDQVLRFTSADLQTLDIPGPMAAPLSKIIADLPTKGASTSAMESAPVEPEVPAVTLEYDGSQSKSFAEQESKPWTVDTMVQVGFVVLQRFAGLLIGKGGNTVKKLTQESGCKHINFGEGLLPGTDLQLMIMKGTTAQVNKAVEKACDLMTSFSASRAAAGEPITSIPEGKAELLMLIPGDHVPVIIGKKGVTIKAIQTDTSCKMKFSDERMDGEKFLALVGTPSNVGACVEAVLRSLTVDDWYQERVIFQQAYSGHREREARKARGDYGPSRDMYDSYGPPRGGYDDYDYGPPRGMYDHYGPPMGRGGYDEYEVSAPKRRRVEEENTGEIWTENTIARVGFVVQKTFAGLLIGPKGTTVKRLTRDSQCQHINFGDGTLPGTDQQLMIIKGNTVQIMTAVEMSCELMDSFARTKKGQDTVASHPEGSVELNMLILEDQVPMVIGKKGSKIRQIEMDTQTKMKFGDQSVANEKLLTIVGSPYGVACSVNAVLRGLPADVWQSQREAFGQAYKGGKEKAGPRERPERRPPMESRGSYGPPRGFAPPPQYEEFPPVYASGAGPRGGKRPLPSIPGQVYR